MTKNVIAFLLTLLSLVVIDGLWLSFITMPLYQKNLSHLLAQTVTMWPVIVFYLLYPLGLCFFVVMPSLARGVPTLWTLGAGFFLGLLAYGAYDLTNLATLRAWPVWLAVMDIFWGATLSAASAFLGAWLTKTIAK